MTNVLLSGSTDGIGLELSRQLASDETRLLLLGRRPLEAIQPPCPHDASNYLRLDLAKSDCAEKAHDFVAQNAPEGLDLLIHNAAAAHWGAVSEQPPSSVRELLDINLTAPLRLTHRLLPVLKKRRGKIVLISSVISALPCAKYPVYGATKAALDGFARSLRIELGDEVAVQLVRPGAARTGMHEKSGLPVEVVDWTRFPPASEVAEKIVAAIRRPDSSPVTLGLGNRLVRFVATAFAIPVDWALRRKEMRP